MRRSAYLVASAVACALVACGGGGEPVMPDAPPSDAPPVDSPSGFAACAKFDTPGIAVPAHVTGALTGADLEAPAQCASVEAPFGVESAGPDGVVRVTGLTPGASYVVHLTAGADLGFYVATGCDSATGPSSAACLLFEDDRSDHQEVGRFVAPATSAYVIVDFYQSTPPHDTRFTLDVYREQCRADVDDHACNGDTPACLDGRCVACVTSFDCTAADRPVCDTTVHACVAGTGGCDTDDAHEPADDGPAGAPALVLDGGGHASLSGEMCSPPAGESDYIAFHVASLGETWDFGLAWAGSRNLDLELFDATGAPLGLSYWEHPERARLTFLAIGTYYVRVSEFSSSSDATPVSYTVSATRTLGVGCTTADECAAEVRNQIFRGACVAGACTSIDGDGTVPEGGACDSQADCASGLSCPSFFFTADASTRETCEPGCTHDSDCAAPGNELVCTTYLAVNQCVAKCTDDAQCPTAIEVEPPIGPWARLACDQSSGRCLP